MAIKFPYELQEGTIAFARHVMANFYKLADGLEDIETNSVVKNQSGNASQIIFDDDESLQDKLDSGGFNDWEGHLYDGYASFFVDNQGHLKVTLAVDAGSDPEYNPYSVNSSGHLILTVREDGDSTPSGAEIVTFDLGSVKGPKGDTGDTGASTTYKGSTIAINAADWDSITKRATVACEGITATNNFIIQPDYDGVIAAHTADPDNTPSLEDVASDWAEAAPIIISQATGSCVVQARGTLPTHKILIAVICNI